MSRIDISLIAAPFIFGLTAWLTRAPWRRVAAALAGGVGFAVLNAAIDVVAFRAEWWWYLGVGADGHAPALWYAAAGLAGSGVSMIGWRVYRRYAVRGLVIFLVMFGLFCVARDSRAAAADDSVIQFAEGAVPRIADALAAIILIMVTLVIQRALGGDLRALRSGDVASPHV